LLLCVAEFINTKDPESDDASNIKVQNEPVNETKKNKAGNKCESSVNGPGMNSP
jgi:hypothetical protein